MICYNLIVEFSQWITEKYDDWRRGKYGNAASIAEFARQFGAPHQIVLNWMKPGSHPPRKRQYVNAIISVYGEEALEPLGIKGPGDEIVSLDQLEPEDRESLSSAWKEILEGGFDPDTEDGLRRIIKILSDHGVKIRSIK